MTESYETYTGNILQVLEGIASMFTKKKIQPMKRVH